MELGRKILNIHGMDVFYVCHAHLDDVRRRYGHVSALPQAVKNLQRTNLNSVWNTDPSRPQDADGGSGV